MSLLASTWRRVRAPGAPAAHRALRLAFAATLGFVCGRYVLDEPEIAVYATLTPVALLTLGEVCGPASVRARAYAGAVAAAVVAAVAGTLASDDTVAASLTLFAGTLVCAQAGIAGSNAAGLSRSVLLVLVVSSGIPAPDSAIPERVAGTAIGGALAAAAVLLLWPDRSEAAFRARLGAAAGRLAEVARSLGERAADAAVTADLQDAGAALADARSFALGIAERPLGAARIAAAERDLATALRDLAAQLAGLGDDVDDRDREMLRAVAAALADAARLLGGDDVAQAEAAVDFPRTRAEYADETDRYLAGQLSAGAAPAVVARTGDRVFHMRRLAALAEVVELQARIAAGLAERERVRTGARRLADQLGIRLAPDSALLHNALRLAAGLAAARAVAGAFDLEHGFWVVFATLTVTRASARGTRATAARAVLGTAIGAVVATLVLLVIGEHRDAYVVLLPLFAFGAVYGSALSFVVGQTGFTLLIVAIFDLLSPASADIGLVRLEDVAIGAVIGLAIGAFAWPRGPAAQLRGALAHAIDFGAGYTRTVTAGLLDASVDPERDRRRAARAARRAEDVFTAYLEEVANRRAAIARWSMLLEQTQRLWYEASLVYASRHPGPHGCPRLATALLGATDRLAAGFRSAGESLRDRVPPGPAPTLPAADESGREAIQCAAAAAGSEDRRRLDGVVLLLGLRAWTGELGRQLDELRTTVGALTTARARG